MNENETNAETGSTEPFAVVIAAAINRRHELLTRGQETADTFFSELEDRINDTAWHHILIQNEIDTKLEKLMGTIDAMQLDLMRVYDVFEKRCQPIVDRTVPVPAAILNKSNELLLLDDDADDDDDDDADDDDDGTRMSSTKTTVTEFEAAILHLTKILMNDKTPRWRLHPFDGIRFRDVDSVQDARLLDSDRDTPEEVTNLLRLYPHALNPHCPPCIIRSVLPRTVVFLPSISSLWMKQANLEVAEEFGYRRYGLVCANVPSGLYYNTIKKLVETPEGVQDKNRFDENCANVMQWLIKENLLLEGDVKGDVNKDTIKFGLFDRLLHNMFFDEYLSRRRFQILVNLWPGGLIQEDNIEPTPLWTVACHSMYRTTPYHCFTSVFKAGIQKFPIHKGILVLFRTNARWKTRSPYEAFMTISTYNNEKIKQSEAIQDTRAKEKFCHEFDKQERLRRFNAIESVLNDPTASTRPPYDAVQALLVAATSDYITLDGVFFILRREPDILLKKQLLLSDDTDDSTKNHEHTEKSNKSIGVRCC